MDLYLKDKIIIVTGGTKGIGGAITRALAREGAIPVFIGRGKEEGERMLEVLSKQNQKGLFIQGDLSTPQTCEKAVKRTLDEYGRIDGLVNNAGANDGIGLECGSPQKFADSVFKNLNHYYEMAHYALLALKESKGNIINMSSKVGLTGQGGTSGYAAAKGAQLALTREWAAELLPYHIRVNAILPAEVMTPLYADWLDSFDNPQEKLTQITSKIPLENRMTKDSEIADLTLFLLSSRSGHTTGQLLSPDGGYVHLDRSLT